jgi:hypothetical protein
MTKRQTEQASLDLSKIQAKLSDAQLQNPDTKINNSRNRIAGSAKATLKTLAVG